MHKRYACIKTIAARSVSLQQVLFIVILNWFHKHLIDFIYLRLDDNNRFCVTLHSLPVPMIDSAEEMPIYERITSDEYNNSNKTHHKKIAVCPLIFKDLNKSGQIWNWI